MIRICAHCGKKFKPNKHNAKYCSDKCRKAATYERKKEKQRKEKEVTRVCKICGKEFITTRSTQKYCSQECAEEVKREREKERSRKRKNGEEVKDTKDIHICWNCANAVPNQEKKTGCSWSINYIPVNGWEATPNDVYYHQRDGKRVIVKKYTVTKCPLFKAG